MSRNATQATGPVTGSTGEPEKTRDGRAGLLGRLVAAIRPEFRGEVVPIDPRDPVFGGQPCRVELCEAATRVRGLCLSHYHRWRDMGKPDIDGFVLTTPAKMRGYTALEGCSVPGCRYGRRGAGLCTEHHQTWRGSGRPELLAWLPTLPETKLLQPPCGCVVSWCTLWAEGTTRLCLSHGSRWRTAGRPNLDDFIRRCDDPTPGFERIDFSRPSRHLRLELQYAVQQRRDHGQIRTPPRHIQHVVNVAADSGVHSLLDWSENTWRTHHRFRSPGASQARALVVWARRQIEDLQHGCGWEVEYPRDVWRLRHLGVATSHAHVRFDRIPQRWLRDLAKRWLRLRLANGHSAGLVVTCAAALTRLGRFLAQPRINVHGIDQLNRDVIELYLADLATSGMTSRRQAQYVSAASVFLKAIRLHRWADDLPVDAMFFAEDYPKRPQQLPRALAEHVMAQIELPANLDRWTTPSGRLITLILIRCGLRIGDVLRLPLECVVRDGDGAPYLRYFNHKMKREALVPIDEELQAKIQAQQHQVLDQWPAGCPNLFPQLKSNVDGQKCFRDTTYREMLRRWLAACDVRDEHGRPVHVTPHQWRHSFGTRLINRDVPQEVVRVLLDHDSHAMTAHYARLHDTTVRRHWENARKVNISGQTVTYDSDEQLSEAMWAKQRLSRATQALPNGYCGLPLVRSCPHANSCLTCPMFLTTTDFLPQHRQQHQQTLQIISAAEARGHARMVEMNRQVADNLEKIIATLEADETPEQVANAV